MLISPRFKLLLFILTCFVFFNPAGPATAADEANHNPTAALGEVQVPIFGPEGFQRVDGLDYDVDRRLAIFHPATSEVLAIYADPEKWKSFFAEIFGTSPRDLVYYATITTAPATGEFETISLNLADLRELLKLNEVEIDRLAPDFQLEPGQPAIAPLELIDQKTRAVTFKTSLMEAAGGDGGGAKLRPRYLAVISALEVDGQLLFLNLFVNRRGPSAETAQALAIAWRDEYLKQTAKN